MSATKPQRIPTQLNSPPTDASKDIEPTDKPATEKSDNASKKYVTNDIKTTDKPATANSPKRPVSKEFKSTVNPALIKSPKRLVSKELKTRNKPAPAADDPPKKCTTDENKTDEVSSGNSFQIETQSDFEAKVQKASKPVIVDFFATWCDPCKALTPRLETVIQRLKGKVQLAKVDIDVMTDLAMDYGISSVPVLVRMKNGKEQDRMVGLQNIAQLEAFIEHQDGQEDEQKAAADKDVYHQSLEDQL